jgi:hypothetical protein
MHRGRSLVVVGGLVIGGAVAFFSPQWWPQARAFFSPQSAPSPPRSPEEDRAFLEQRVKEYWQARVEGNPSLSFQYEHPVQQDRWEERKYRRQLDSAIQVKEFTILDITLEPDGEKAQIRLGAKYQHNFRNIPGAKPIIVSTYLSDYWQKEEGIWYHVIDPKVVPDGKPYITKKAAPAS